MKIITDHPIALDSMDHIHPRGTASDNHYSEAFNDKLCALYPNGGVSVLDLGCAGGGLVRSLLARGVFAVGIEGSDFSKRTKRAEWRDEGCPDNLLTADITKQFTIYDNKFDVVTMWEVIEHIAEADLPQVFENIDRHLKPDGKVILSICPHSDKHDDVEYHRTIRPFEWWVAKFAELGWRNVPKWISWFGVDWVRGGVSYAVVDGELQLKSNAWGSFHLVLERAKA